MHGFDGVSDDALLMRYLSVDRLPKGDAGKDHPASDSWKPSSDGTGTSICILEGDITPDGYLAHTGQVGLVVVRARDLRLHEFSKPTGHLCVVRDPDPLDPTIYGDSHALIMDWPVKRTHISNWAKELLWMGRWLRGPVAAHPALPWDLRP